MYFVVVANHKTPLSHWLREQGLERQAKPKGEILNTFAGK